MFPMQFNSTQITTVLLIIQATVTFLISVRAFALYPKTRSPLLFIVGMSMGMITFVGVVGIIGDNYNATYFDGHFTTKWFRYLAQIVSYAFIFLSSLRTSERYLRHVRIWQWIFTVLLLATLALIPFVPQIQFTSPTIEASVSLLRGVITFVIFLNYVMIFMRKESRFSFLMGLAFLLIAFGIAITTPQYFEKDMVLYLYVGDSVRTLGLITLLVAFYAG